MPPCEVRIYQNDEDDVPFVTWLESLTRPSKKQNLRAAAAVRACVEKLAAHGHALRRLSADYLEREIYANPNWHSHHPLRTTRERMRGIR